MKPLLLAAALLALNTAAPAAMADGDAELQALREKLAPMLQVGPDDLKATPIAGIYEVRHDHDFSYVSADGKYVLHGDLIEVNTGRQLTEEHRRAERVAALKTLQAHDFIEFAPAAPVAAKYEVTVFTDVDCGYCRLLHSKMSEYNQHGIAIRYLSFPRTGPNSTSWHRAEAVWCSSDPRASFTAAVQGAAPALRKCEDPVAKEYKLAAQFGITGTPMMIMPDGEVLQGLMLPDELADYLGKDKTQSDSVALKLNN